MGVHTSQEPRCGGSPCTGQGPRCGGPTSQGNDLGVGGRPVLVRGLVVGGHRGIYIYITSQESRCLGSPCTGQGPTWGGFLSPRMHPFWYDTDSDVCLASIMINFGLVNAPPSLDFYLFILFSPKCQWIPINLTEPYCSGGDQKKKSVKDSRVLAESRVILCRNCGMPFEREKFFCFL